MTEGDTPGTPTVSDCEMPNGYSLAGGICDDSR